MLGRMIPFPINPTRTGGSRDEEIAFLHALLSNPDDDATRLVYADWLEDQDESERAEFIRLRFALQDPARQSEFGTLYLNYRTFF